MRRIDYSRLRGVDARAITRAIRADGFRLVRQRGSHHQFAHPDGRRVTVAYTRMGDTFAIKTLQDIIEWQANWNAADLRRLGLL